MQKKDITLHNIGNEQLREKPNSISVRYFEDKSVIYGSRGTRSVCAVDSSVFGSLLIMASLGASCVPGVLAPILHTGGLEGGQALWKLTSSRPSTALLLGKAAFLVRSGGTWRLQERAVAQSYYKSLGITGIGGTWQRREPELFVSLI